MTIEEQYVKIGKNFKYKEPCNIGGYGFHLKQLDDGSHIETPHNYNVIIGDDVSIGALCCIDRGSWRDTVIGGGVKTDNLVHIAHNCIIGKHVKIGAGAMILGSVEIGDYTTIWSSAVIHQHVKIGRNCIVGANSYLRHDLKDGEVAYGSPAQIRHGYKYPHRLYF